MLEVCRSCGCTNFSACDGGCWWVEDDLCSSCARLSIDVIAAGDSLTPDELVGRWSAPAAGIEVVGWNELVAGLMDRDAAMSPILDLQQQWTELGRIRTGIQVEYVKNGQTRTRPEKLETFRLTSRHRELIDAAVEAYGDAEVRPWGEQWEVVTPAKAFDILVPPGQTLTQWNELWSGGGCLRRCDGVTNHLDHSPCACPADPAERRKASTANPPTACHPTTRLSVMLRALPGIGVWRLESHGYYAAVELRGSAQLLSRATEAGLLMPASLRLEQREKKVPGKPTNRYAVPVIDIVHTRLVDLLPAGSVRDPIQIGAGAMPLLGSGRPALPSTPPPATSDLRAQPDELVDERILGAAGDPPTLLEQLRERAAVATVTGPKTELQHEVLAEIFAPLRGLIGDGLDLVFGPGSRDNVSAAAAQAIASQARAMGPEAFTQAWRQMVADGGPDGR
jgi:hypothetical protein